VRTQAGLPPASEMAMTKTPDAALLDAAKNCRLAEGLDAEQATVLAGLMTLESLAPRQVLAREGETDQRLYAVVEGSLNIVKHVGTPDETLLATLKTGDLAHELGFLDGAPRHASLLADSAARVLVLDRDKLESLIDTHPRILYRVMCAIARNVHRVQTAMAVQATELTNYIVKQHGRY
jgi:CRP/FNR family cyclic AMP-dependent transcriptional regulator